MNGPAIVTLRVWTDDARGTAHALEKLSTVAAGFVVDGYGVQVDGDPIFEPDTDGDPDDE